MKVLVWVLVVLMSGAPAWAAGEKMTVKQLKDLLVTMQTGKKTDEEVSTRIKEIELSEELTATEKSNLMFTSPGPLTSEQICVLEARSSILKPPAADLPEQPAPDAAAQKAILDKAAAAAAKNDQQIPRIAASRAVARYGHLNDFNGWSGRMSPNSVAKSHGDRTVLALTSKYVDSIEIIQGKEKVTGSGADPRLRRTSPWAEDVPRPALSQILSKAIDGGKVLWLRWETINGTKTAVFSFAINKKSSPYVLDYCCFLISDGLAIEWKPFKKTVGLHGEFFIDPDTGTTLRVVLLAEPSASDQVAQEDTRIDYGAVAVDGKTYTLPTISYTHTDVETAGDTAKGILMRMTFLVTSYGNYHTAEAGKK